MLVAPSEPPLIKTLGKSSSQPEKFGVDVMWAANSRLCGVQRKELKDFLASIHDGRLAREIAQMSRLGFAALVLEGKPRWSLDNQLLTENGWGFAWSRTQHRNYLTSLQVRGIVVQTSDDMADTVCAIRDLRAWAGKEAHRSLESRPKPVSSWGKAGHREFQSHLLQSFDGIGPAQAERILEFFGKPPLEWTVGEKELRQVDGIGAVRARRLIAALEKEDVKAGVA